MQIQFVVTLALIALASGYLCLRGWRTFAKSKKGCGGGCGCAGSSAKKAEDKLIPSSQLTMRRRG